MDIVAGPPIRIVAQDDTARLPRAAWVALGALACAAVLLRFGLFGDPIAGLDEQFYLLVGDRMWHGELPYLDIWDRKPVGLFVLFAGIRLLPGDGVLAAQLVATAFATATALLIAIFARKRVGWIPATMAGIFYLAALNTLWGDTTQTPVFYDLFVMAAACLTVRAAESADDRSKIQLGVAAMALIGIAIQIKTNAIFQGAFFGAWLLWSRWRQSREVAATLRLMLPLTIAAAVPTVAAMLTYTALGHFDAWWQANILSVIAKGRPADPAAMDNFASSIILTSPALAVALLGLWARTRRFETWDGETAFLLGWIALSVVDFGAIGGYFPHYAIPLVLACCPLIADAFAIRRFGTALFIAVLAWPLFYAVRVAPRVGAKEREYAAKVLAALPGDVRTRCLFIYEGPVAYYQLSHACRVSRFAFTGHLSSTREAGALGVDQAQELRATLARQPGTIITIAHSSWTDRNPAMERLLAATLARDYHPIAQLPHRVYTGGHDRLVIWRRNDPAHTARHGNRLAA